MSTVRMTPARLDLLRAVERGEVKHWPGGLGMKPYDVCYPDGRMFMKKTVTGALAPLVKAGLVAGTRDPLHMKRRELTDAGRAVLAEADKSTPEPSGISPIEADAIELAGVPEEFLGRVLDAESEDQS